MVMTMGERIERMLFVISDSESFGKSGTFSKFFCCGKEELTEYELEAVAAAAKPNYQKFLMRINGLADKNISC